MSEQWLLSVGCGGGDASEDAQPTTTSTTTTKATGRAPVTAESLVGKWKQMGTLLVVLFRPNGTFVMDTSGTFEVPAAAGEYKVSGGGTVRFTASASSFCASGDTWVWRASIHDLTREDYLYARYIKGNGGCKLETGTFTRVG